MHAELLANVVHVLPYPRRLFVDHEPEIGENNVIQAEQCPSEPLEVLRGNRLKDRFVEGTSQFLEFLGTQRRIVAFPHACIEVPRVRELAERAVVLGEPSRLEQIDNAQPVLCHRAQVVHCRKNIADQRIRAKARRRPFLAGLGVLNNHPEDMEPSNLRPSRSCRGRSAFTDV